MKKNRLWIYKRSKNWREVGGPSGEFDIVFEVLPLGRRLGRKRGRFYFVHLSLSGFSFSYIRWYDRITYYSLVLLA